MSYMHGAAPQQRMIQPEMSVMPRLRNRGADGNSFQEHMGGVWMVLDQGGTSDLMSKGMRSEA